MTTPMPTPNIPDEVVEVADEAFSDVYDGVSHNRRQAIEHALQAALPLLLEQVDEQANNPRYGEE